MDILFISTIVILTEVGESFGKLTLDPPWIQTIQYVNHKYTVKCDGSGEKYWTGPHGKITDKKGVRVLRRKGERNSLYLQFDGILKEHKGEYECSSEFEDQKHKVQFNLIVIQPVVFENTTSVQVITEGNSTVLDCTADGEPTPEITWHFNGQLIKDSSNEELLITNVSWKDAGIYVCRAFQGILQTRNAEKMFRLKVQHKPLLPGKQSPFNTSYGFRNETANVTCSVLAEPAAYFIWYHQEKPIDPKKYGVTIYNEENTSIMQLPLYENKYFGVYTCEAANNFGIINITIKVEEIERPKPPLLIISNVMDKICTVALSNNTLTTEYKIQYTEYTYCSYDEKWERALSLAVAIKQPITDRTRVNITNLHPYTKYVIRASSCNNGGCSDYSQEELVRTRKSDSSVQNINRVLVLITILCPIFKYFDV